MSIVKLTIKNFLSIQDVEIQPGKVNQIVGKNNQGKTTILKALEFAFKGSTDGSLVKRGEDSAEVIVELDNEMVVRRRINSAGKQSVSVKNSNGFGADKPQAFLSSLFDGMNFNPLEILNPETRTKFILKALNFKLSKAELASLSEIAEEELPPLDYDNENALIVIEQAHKYFYQRRAEANRVAAEKRARFETYKKDLPPLTEAPRSKESVQKQLDSLKLAKAECENLKKEIEAGKEKAIASAKRIEKYETELKKIDSSIEALKSEYETNLAVLLERQRNGNRVLTEAVMQKYTEPRDLLPVVDSLNAYEKDIAETALYLKDIAVWEAQQKQREAVEGMEKEVLQAEGDASKFDRRVKALGDQAKEKIMEKSVLPIEGLSYVDGEFGLNGANLDHLSTSMALRLSLSLVKALTEKTKLICIDGAELLDPETFEALREEMENDDFTYFFTKVGEPFEGGDKAFLAEAGNIKELH